MLFEHNFVLAAFLVGVVEGLLLYHPVILFYFLRFFAILVLLMSKNAQHYNRQQRKPLGTKPMNHTVRGFTLTLLLVSITPNPYTLLTLAEDASMQEIEAKCFEW